MMRVAAEAENTRKRLERERTEGVAFANESLIRAMLPVLDNLERAVQHGDKNSNTDSLLEGVSMTIKGFLDTLAKFGCVPFVSEGKSFDPNFHEALMQQEKTDLPDGTVLQELEKGYTLKERLLRPAKVVVSKRPCSPTIEKADDDISHAVDSEDDDKEPPKKSNEGAAKKVEIRRG
jgi:molecular chaperone GrpE